MVYSGLYLANMGVFLSLHWFFLLAGLALTSTGTAAQNLVQVQLTSGTNITGRLHSGVETYNGIPYADPPIGPLRLRPPQKISRHLDSVDGTGIAAACPQLLLSPADKNIISSIGSQILDLPFFKDVKGQEDCLTVSVQRPANIKPGDKLPVLFWMYGGGFALGSTNTYDGASLVREGVANNQPFIFVAVNYRVGGFGFMPGIEMLNEGSANAGLLDQRMGLEWVADNIDQFGGDPDRVTLWGESAGSISVFYQMALYGGNSSYKGKPLFRGGIMNSGTTIPAEPMDGFKGQATYNQVLKEAGCAGTVNNTLSCLRELDYDTFYNAVTQTFSGVFSFSGTKISFPPRPDGKVLPLSPEELAATGQYYAVPMIAGDQEDEGTIFALYQQSVKTSDDLVNYFSQFVFPNATKEQLSELVEAYTKDDEGSPFRTGPINSLYPMYKRIAAIIGDVTFTLSRRSFLEATAKANPNMPAWSFLSSYAHPLPILGTFHASDLIQIFYGIPPTHATSSTRQYYFNFLYNQDPNKGNKGQLDWPVWKGNNTLMWFKTQLDNGYLTDSFRNNQYIVLAKLAKAKVLRQ